MDKTAFVTRRGQFRFKVLSFGLANASSLFQRIMDLVLAGLTWNTCLVFVDDDICFVSSFEEHVEGLGQLFARLSAAGLKLKPSNCKLFQRRVAFLGHIVSQDGVEADPPKYQLSSTGPLHETWVRSEVSPDWRLTTEISFRISALLCRCCFDLTRKGVPFICDEKCLECFLSFLSESSPRPRSLQHRGTEEITW